VTLKHKDPLFPS